MLLKLTRTFTVIGCLSKHAWKIKQASNSFFITLKNPTKQHLFNHEIYELCPSLNSRWKSSRFGISWQWYLCLHVRYLDDFLGQTGVEPLEPLPVGDEQLKHIAGCLSHCFVPKLDGQTRRQEPWHDSCVHAEKDWDLKHVICSYSVLCDLI